MSWQAKGASILLLTICLCAESLGAETRFAQTHSRSQYVHWIDLYDATNRKIDPADPNAAPYSPVKTCGRCHDYKAISHGYHFNALHKEVPRGRRGEPWIWTDPRTGTQIPLSYRGWHGTYDPGELGISARSFILKFGHHLPGGGPGEPPEEPADDAPKETAAETPTEAPAEGGDSNEDAEAQRWNLSGELSVDCMMCHAGDRSYSPEVWWEQIQEENFAWAPTAALGLGHVDGEVSRLPDDFDPATVDENSRYKLPTTTYAPLRTNAEKKVFFDVVRQPHDNACYYCHSSRLVGEGVPPEWMHDEDVHIRAGMSCTDCHRNGIAHHTVRGFEGEEHPSGQSVAALSCRGCHTDDGPDSGRFGAPKPLHKGLPPIHFDKLSCTACHSGPRPGEQAFVVQTALAHQLGLPSHDEGDPPPGIVTPIFKRGGEGGVLYPHRMMWPAFWGTMKDGHITPLNPEAVYDATRKTLRVRRGSFAEQVMDADLSSSDKKELLGEDRYKLEEDELTEDEKAKLADAMAERGRKNWQEKLAGALTDLKGIIEEGAAPVYISGGKAYRLGSDGTAEEFDNEATEPYAWKLAHDVRPARWSLGAKGCFDCHAADAPIFEGKFTAMGPAPDEEPVTLAMREIAESEFDKTKLDAWNQSFQGRTAFKWLGFVSSGAVGLILLTYLLLGFNGLAGMIRRK